MKNESSNVIGMIIYILILGVLVMETFNVFYPHVGYLQSLGILLTARLVYKYVAG